MLPATSGMSRWRSSRTVTNPGLPPLGEASQRPSASAVAMTRNGDRPMNARTSSDRKPLTFCCTRSTGAPNCRVKRLSKEVTVVDIKFSLSHTFSSSASRTLRARASGANGFWRNAMSAPRTPWRTISSSVYPDM